MSPTLATHCDWIMIGCGNHALMLLEMIRSAGVVPPRTIVSFDQRQQGQTVDGMLVLAAEEVLPRMAAAGCVRGVIGVGDEGDVEPRRQAHVAAIAAGIRPMIIRHESAIVSPSALLAAGVQLMAGAIISPQCELAENVLINSGAILQAATRVGTDSHIAPGARLLGGASVGARTHIGAGTIVLAGVSIGDDCLVAPGMVISQSMPAGSTAVGVPSRVIEPQGWRIAG